MAECANEILTVIKLLNKEELEMLKDISKGIEVNPYCAVRAYVDVIYEADLARLVVSTEFSELIIHNIVPNGVQVDLTHNGLTTSIIKDPEGMWHLVENQEMKSDKLAQLSSYFE
jgi:hypothetical protein